MRRGEQIVKGTVGSRFTALANLVVKIVGMVIFAYLTWYAFQYTQYMNPFGEERSINVKDSLMKNILFLLLTVAVTVALLVLERYLSQNIRKWVMRISVFVSAFWVGACGLWWITTIDRQPVGDQAFIYGGASFFLEGQYSFLQQGGYCDVYPHQLGLIFLTEMLFALAGIYNYFAFQVICVEMAVGIVLLGNVLVRKMTDHMAAAVFYCLSMLFCLPLIFYTGWVYGDIPSIFFALLTAVCLLYYDESSKTAWLIGMVLSVLMALLVRKNSMIMLIALCLTAGVRMISKRDLRLLAALLAAVLLPVFAYQGIYKMYELRSGYPHSQGVPPISFVAMGMQEENGQFGWYNNYGKEVYFEQACDSELTRLVSRQYIQRRLEEFSNDEDYFKVFFREKVLSQWNAPLYQSMYFSSQHPEEMELEEGTFIYKLETEYFLNVLEICDRLQFILYFGMVCYFLFGVKRNSNILHHMLAVVMIGGFFFSFIWEAKARYIFPYYVTMYPLAAIGYYQAAAWVRRLFAGKQTQEHKEDVGSFEQVA